VGLFPVEVVRRLHDGREVVERVVWSACLDCYEEEPHECQAPRRGYMRAGPTIDAPRQVAAGVADRYDAVP